MIATDSKENLTEKVKFAYNLSEKFNHVSQNNIKVGSNEHLDLISENTLVFSQLIDVLAKVNDLIEINFPSNKTEGEEIKLALHSLHSSLDLFVRKIKSTNLANESYTNSISLLEDENSQIIEYINDINDYVLADDDLFTFDFPQKD